MISAIHTFRVRYGETDKMGFVYYGNYPEYFEVGRVELFRKLFISYKELEDVHGILMPVLSLNINYKKPIFYDEEFSLKTILSKIEGIKFTFEYEIKNSKQEACTTGSTTLIFIDKETQKPIKIPDFIMQKIEAQKNLS